MVSKPPRRQFRIGNVLKALLIVYAVTIISGCLPDKLILFPSTGRIDSGGTSRRIIKTENGIVEAWTMDSLAVRKNQPPEAFVLTFIGNASRAEYEAADIASRWTHRPVQVWAVNYPGYGGSSGSAQLKAIPTAALAAYDNLKQNAGGKPIYLSGVSLGTTAALYVAANRPCAGLVLQNPPPLQSMILGHFGWWNLWLLAGPVAMQIPAELNSLITAPHVTAPAVFLLAERDRTVPPEYQKKVYDAYAGPKRIIPMVTCDHNDPMTMDAYRQFQSEVEWLWQQRPDATTRPATK